MPSNRPGHRTSNSQRRARRENSQRVAAEREAAFQAELDALKLPELPALPSIDQAIESRRDSDASKRRRKRSRASRLLTDEEVSGTPIATKYLLGG